MISQSLLNWGKRDFNYTVYKLLAFFSLNGFSFWSNQTIGIKSQPDLSVSFSVCFPSPNPTLWWVRRARKQTHTAGLAFSMRDRSFLSSSFPPCFGTKITQYFLFQQTFHPFLWSYGCYCLAHPFVFCCPFLSCCTSFDVVLKGWVHHLGQGHPW